MCSAAGVMVRTGEGSWGKSLTVMRPALALSDQGYMLRVRDGLVSAGVVDAVRTRNSRPIFEWMVDLFQYQGVSDAAAEAFNAKHGGASFADLNSVLSRPCACPKLSSYWAFSECGFRKGQQTCARPDLLGDCPLPLHPARNGRLSQATYSLFLFIRDVCDGDLIGWIDDRVADGDTGGPDRAEAMQRAVLDPMTNIFGVSSKVLSMILADLLLGADPKRERWVTTGASMIAIDTLVHNFMHRTGITDRHGLPHAYGPACYGAGGCADIVRGLAARIDARTICPDGPACFPRLIQSAIWSFCAQSDWNICNGNRIDDRRRCTNRYCPSFRDCERRALRPV